MTVSQQCGAFANLNEDQLPPKCSCPMTCYPDEHFDLMNERPDFDHSAFDVHDTFVKGSLWDPQGRVAHQRSRRGRPWKALARVRDRAE